VGRLRNILGVGLPRPQRHAGRVEWQRRRDALTAELLVEWREVADPDVVGEHGAGRLFIPDTVTPLSSSATTCRLGSSRAWPGKMSRLGRPVGGTTAKHR